MHNIVSSILQRIRSVGRHELGLLLAIASVTASLWIFVTISEEVVENEHRGIDKRILLAFRTSQDLAVPVGPKWVKNVSLDISSLGSASVLLLITLLISGYLLLERKLAAALFLLFAALTGTALNQFLKEFFSRERPLIVPHLAEVSNSSFPSGHSMLSSIIYLTLAVLLAKTVDKPSTKMYLIGSAFFLAFLVGMTRIIIGVHYPSDVLAGWTAGTAWAMFCWLAATWISRRGTPLN